MLKVTKADESDFHNIIIRAKSHDLIYDQGKLQHWNLQQIRVIIVIDLKALKTRDCWNIVVRQGPIPWFDLWAGSGPWGKSSMGGWEGKRSLFAATQQRKPSQSSALLAIQCKYDGKIITAWLTPILMQKQKAFCTFNERDTLTFNNWSLIIALHIYNVNSLIKLKGLRFWDARLSFQFKTLMISFSSSIENKIKRQCNGFESRLFKIWLKPVLFSNLVDSGTCQATTWPLVQTTLVHLGVTNVTCQTCEMHLDA